VRSFSKAATAGAAIGIAVALLLTGLVFWRPFPVAVNSSIERLTFALCPLYILGFAGWPRSMIGVLAVTVASNAILYAGLFVLGYGAIKLAKKAL
jgi:hypothetical protein